MPRLKQRTPQLREQVLRVAVETLAQRGVADFTTRRVAEGAQTSTAAVYELFGDKAGLLREVFYEGFRTLQRRFDRLASGDDPRASLMRALHELRNFNRDNPVLAKLMFARPFADFDPGPSEVDIATCPRSGVRRFIVERIRACVRAKALVGNEADIAHVLISLTEGLTASESAGWLGSTKPSIERRWNLAVSAILDGLTPAKRRT